VRDDMIIAPFNDAEVVGGSASVVPDPLAHGGSRALS